MSKPTFIELHERPDPSKVDAKPRRLTLSVEAILLVTEREAEFEGVVDLGKLAEEGAADYSVIHLRDTRTFAVVETYDQVQAALRLAVGGEG